MLLGRCIISCSSVAEAGFRFIIWPIYRTSAGLKSIACSGAFISRQHPYSFHKSFDISYIFKNGRVKSSVPESEEKREYICVAYWSSAAEDAVMGSLIAVGEL